MKLSAGQLADALNRLDFVIWDEITEHTYSTVVNGFIPNPGSERDYVTLTFECREGDSLLASFNTSSTVYRREIARRLTPWGVSELYVEPERVEDAFGALVHNVTDRRRLRRVA